MSPVPNVRRPVVIGDDSTRDPAGFSAESRGPSTMKPLETQIEPEARRCTPAEKSRFLGRRVLGGCPASAVRHPLRILVSRVEHQPVVVVCVPRITARVNPFTLIVFRLVSPG